MIHCHREEGDDLIDRGSPISRSNRGNMLTPIHRIVAQMMSQPCRHAHMAGGWTGSINQSFLRAQAPTPASVHIVGQTMAPKSTETAEAGEITVEDNRGHTQTETAARASQTRQTGKPMAADQARQTFRALQAVASKAPTPAAQ